MPEIPFMTTVLQPKTNCPLVHLHFLRKAWRVSNNVAECARVPCVLAITLIEANLLASRVVAKADEAFCAEIGHLDFEYESGSYCGRCGAELSRREVCECEHPKIEHGIVKTSDAEKGSRLYSVPTTYPNACKRFGCNDCLAYKVKK